MNKGELRKKRGRVNHDYSADRPIHSKKEDILKRAKFAERLATDLKAWDGTDSLVVALYGAWGSGKSSVKSMVLEAILRKRHTEIPVMEFNPWQLSGTGDIPTRFFHELRIALNKEGPHKDVKKRAAKLKYYSGIFTLAGFIAKPIGSLRTSLGKTDGPIIEAAAEGLTAAGSVTTAGAETLTGKDESEEKSLHELKNEVSAFMAALPRPILVVIDDIDRLTRDEILQVFQLVKINADFPRLVFLLLFERQIITSALDAISDNKGVEFLEKIVQVGYHIPHASHVAVHKALFSGLEPLLSAEAISKRWEKQRWVTIFTDGLSSYFCNLRHVKRFLASFAFHVRAHRSEKSFEVNPVDLIALETLRVFEPAVYERLPGAKTILTRYEGPRFFGEIKQELIDQAVSQIVSAADSKNQSKVKAILEVLFPPIGAGYSGRNEVSNHQQDWLRELRVCHPALFDKYFTLTVSDDDLSQSELDGLLALTANTKDFMAACKELEKRALLHLAFERLDAYREQISLQVMPSLIQALCDMSDDFPERRSKSFEEMLTFDTNTYAWRLCYFGLKREPDKNKRFQILRDVISRSSGLALPFELVSHDDRVGDREARGHEFLLEASDLEELRKLCVQKFKNAIKDLRFRQSSQFRFVFLSWGYWELPNEVKVLIKTEIRTPADVLWLLTLLLEETHSHGSDHRVRYSMKLSSLERFTEIAHLTDLLKKFEHDNLSKRETVARREFNKALKRRANGQADNVGDLWNDPDEEIVE